MIVIIIIIAGIWWYMSSSSSSTPTAPAATETQQSNTGVTGTSPTDDSDAAMAQDTSAIDTQMTGLTSDNESADQGLASQ